MRDITTNRPAHFVDCELQSIIQHSREKHLEQIRALLEARVRIGLYQPRVVLPVYYIVIAKDLEALAPFVRIQLSLGRLQRELCIAFYFCKDLLLEERIQLAVLLFQVLPELGKAHLVAIFKVTVSRIMLLDGVVRQVHPIVGECRCISRVLT